MIAQNLKDAYGAFVPIALVEKEELDSFYISRGRNLVKLFSTLTDASIKVLFTGHYGSGKTTELNYSENALSSKYTVLNLQIGKHLDIEKRINSREILKAILYALDPNKESKIKMKKKLLEIIADTKFSPIAKGLSSDTSAKEYIFDLNKKIEILESKTGKRVLIFIDDLDKQLFGIEKILLEVGKIFNEIACSLVLTVPLTTIYSPLANLITEWFSRVEVLPIIPPKNKKGKINQKGLERLRNLVLKRMDKTLIDEDALENAILYSGGIFRYLVKIIQDSAFRALNSGRDKISKEDTTKSIKIIRSVFGRTIGFDNYDRLKEIHENKNLINVEEDVRFLANDIVLEYQADTRWVDIHPAIESLLPCD